MVFNFAYWTKVLKRIGILFFSALGIYFAIKLSIFYMPFLIALIIALILEPVIKFLIRNTNLNRKTSSILVLLIFFGIIIGLSIWGITRIIAESSDLLARIKRICRTSIFKMGKFYRKNRF